MKNARLISIMIVAVLFLSQRSSLAEIELFGYFIGYAELENDYGEYKSDWPVSAKASFVKLMFSHGIAKDEASAMEILQGNTSESEQDELASAIIEAYFSEFLVPEARATIGVMMHELGAFETWPYEAKALSSSLDVQYGKQKPDWPLYMLPLKGDLQEEEAIWRAAEKLSQVFGYSEEYILDSPAVETYFIKENFSDDGHLWEDPIWLIEFRNPDMYAGAFSVKLSRHGDILMYKAPDTLPFYGDEDILAEARSAIPSEHDVSAEEVIQYAVESITEVSHYTPEEAKALRAESHFIYHERFCLGWEPVWLLYFYEEDEPVYKALYAYNGSYINIVPHNEEFTNTIQFDFFAGDVLGINFAEIGFGNMSTEERAAFSQKWKPIVDAYVQSHPYYINHHDLLYYATRNVYGIPGSDDISQAEAIRIAQEAAINIGVNPSTMERRRITALFDVTEIDNPIWKIIINQASVSDIIHKMIEENRTMDYAKSVTAEYEGRYYIVINARTGEVITAHLVSDEETVWDHIF